MIEGVNANRTRVKHHNYDKTCDQSMSSCQPREDKLRGLSNISFIKRKPKPVGTEFKTMCDSETGIMAIVEIQEGSVHMQRARHARLLGVTVACTLRHDDSRKPSTCVMCDSWFASVKIVYALYQRGYEFLGVIKEKDMRSIRRTTSKKSCKVSHSAHGHHPRHRGKSHRLHV